MLGRNIFQRHMFECFGKINSWISPRRQGGHTKPGRRRLGVESLEDRRLLSVDLIGDLIKVSAAGSVAWSADAREPSVACDHEHGQYLAVWRADTRDDGRDEVFGQLIDGDGNKVGGQIEIATFAADSLDARTPDVAYNPTRDEYLVVWKLNDTSGANNAYGRLVDYDGTPDGDVIQISQVNNNKSANIPAVAYNSALDEFLVVWSSDTEADNISRIYGQKLVYSGSVLGESGGDFEITDETTTMSTSKEQTVTYNSFDDEYLVTWENLRPSTKYEVYGQRLTSTAGFEGTNFQITSVGPAASADNPRIAFNSTDHQYLLVYQLTPPTQIYGQRLSNIGTAVGSAFAISDVDSARPDVDYNSTGNEYMVVWRDNPTGGKNVHARTVDNAGNPDAVTLQVSDVEDRDANDTPMVAYNSDDDQYLVVWRADGPPAQTASNVEEIFAQRVGEEAVQVDISITKDDGDGGADNLTVVAGQDQVTYTVTVTNDGPSNATGIVVNDPLSLPTGVTLNNATTSQGSYVSGTGVWTVGDLVNGASATLTIVLDVASNTADGEVISNTATLDSVNETDTNPANDSDTETTDVAREVDIRVEKDDGDGGADNLTVIAGQDQVTYTVTVTNDGPSDASSVVVNDPLSLPTGVSLNNATTSQGSYIAGTGVWTVGNLANGANATLTIVLNVASNTADGQVISNTASLDSVNETETNPANDSDTETTNVAREVDIRVEKDDGDGGADNLTVIAGQDQVTYTVTVTNDGPSDASGIVVNDPLSLPTGVSLNNATTSQGSYIAGTGVWTVGNLADGANATLTIVLNVASNTADGQVISNTASLDSVNETETNPANDSDTETTDVAREVDIRVEKDDGDGGLDNRVVIAGNEQLIYVVLVTNDGPSDATNIVVNDPLSLPTGVTLDFFTETQGTYDSGTGVWTVGDLANGATAGLTIVLNVASNTADGQVISNTASLDSVNETETNPANDSDTETTDVAREVDIRVEKDDGDGGLDNRVVIAGNEQLIYVVLVTNDGPSDATNIVVNDPLSLPTGVTLDFFTETQGTYDSGTGVWTVGDLANGATAGLTIVLDVASNTADGQVISNTASLDSVNETETNPANDSDTETTDVAREVDLQVSKLDTPDPVTAGSGASNLTHTVTVTNAGPSDATGVELSETVSLPAGASIVSITPSGTTTYAPADTSPGTWTVGDLASGDSETLTIVMTVDATTSAGAVVSDTATVTAATETLINTSDDTATETTTVQGRRDLVGVFRNNKFFLDHNGNGKWDGTDGGDAVHKFGGIGDLPVTGDWNGDGFDEVGVYRPLNSKWYLDSNANGVWDPGVDLVRQFGVAGVDIPVVGDWNGDGTDDVGVRRNENFLVDLNGSGRWDTVAGGDAIYGFGSVIDLPAVGDWNADKVEDPGIRRNKRFFVDSNGNQHWDGTDGGDDIFIYRVATDLPVTGDWVGDGKDQIGTWIEGIFRLDGNDNGTWDKLAGGDISYSFGLDTDTPITGKWAPQPYGPGLLAAPGAAEPAAEIESLTPDMLAPIAQQAFAAWSAAPLSADQQQVLGQVQFRIVDLPGASLGRAFGSTITLDVNAAGWGWNLAEYEEQTSQHEGDTGDPQSFDLLTAVMHEIGHVLGLPDDFSDPDSDSLMNGWLDAGERRTLTASERDHLFTDADWLNAPD